jgi:hypothetical protein
LYARFAGRFTRSEPRRRARQYLSGLVAGLDRKNGWTLAEQAGDVSPDGMQRLLRRADWDVDAVRDYVIEHLGDRRGVLIIDDTGFLKKGVKSAGVQRQYSGTAGRIENCQIGVFLAYRSEHGHALIDRRLYLPAGWTEDRDRCRAAGIPDEIGFATKIEMARKSAVGWPIGSVFPPLVGGGPEGCRSPAACRWATLGWRERRAPGKPCRQIPLGEKRVADRNPLSWSGSYGRRPSEVNLPTGSRSVSRWQWGEASGSA